MRKASRESYERHRAEQDRELRKRKWLSVKMEGPLGKFFRKQIADAEGDELDILGAGLLTPRRQVQPFVAREHDDVYRRRLLLSAGASPSDLWEAEHPPAPMLLLAENFAPKEPIRTKVVWNRIVARTNEAHRRWAEEEQYLERRRAVALYQKSDRSMVDLLMMAEATGREIGIRQMQDRERIKRGGVPLLEPRVWVLVKGGQLFAAGFTKSEAERAAKERALVAVTASEYLAGGMPMMIMTSGRWHYTDLAYTCDGNSPTVEEQAEMNAREGKLVAAGWERAFVDDTEMTSPYREPETARDDPEPRWVLLWCGECRSRTGTHAESCPSVLRSMTWWQRLRRMFKK